jgi:hypothetical protein
MTSVISTAHAKYNASFQAACDITFPLEDRINRQQS